jgi:lipopolysaccharide transport system permease protein
MLRSIWQFRGFVASLVLQDFRNRSARTLWGHAWLVIEPAIQITIYVLIFSEVLRARLPGTTDGLSYGFYVCSGLLAWNFFAELLLGGRTLFLEHADLLRTIRFPRATLPLALALRCVINAAIPITILLLVTVALDRWPGSLLAAALPFLAIQTLLGLGLGVLCGTLNVFIRDVGNLVVVALQFWFWLTPVVYPLSIVPEAVRAILAWNPMLHVIAAYQSVIVHRVSPDFSPLLPLAATTLALASVAWLSFRFLGPDLVDEL